LINVGLIIENVVCHRYSIYQCCIFILNIIFTARCNA